MYKNDTLVSEENFHNGLYHGESKYYDPFNNFQLSCENLWKKNKRHGLMRLYREEDGALQAEILWKKGKKRKYKCWDINGQPIECDFKQQIFNLREACIDDDGNAVWCDILSYPNY